MKTVTVAEAAERFASVLDQLERDQEEVTVMRDDQAIARIIPEPARGDALNVLGDLYGILQGEAGKELSKSVAQIRKKKNQKLKALRNPWPS